MKQPLVTAIVSTYNAERFMRGCLENLERQTIAPELEIIVVDSDSQQNEGDIVREFAERYDNIRYVRTAQREGLYEAWNRAIGLARGKYLTNANTDDRHRSDAYERLVERLDAEPEVALAYGDYLVSNIENETYEACIARGAKVLRMPEYTPRDLMLRCITGCQPMWRAIVHKEHGLFDPRFRIAGDYEYWIRIAQTRNISHVKELIGVAFASPFTLGLSNKWQCEIESMQIRQAYLPRDPWRQDNQLPASLAAELFGIGYQYVQRRERKRAMPFLMEAWRLDPLNFRFAKTILLRGWIGLEMRLDGI